MPTFPFVTLDVFTETRFGGNPLAVFTDAVGLTGEQMQALATEFNLSETTFVLPPEDPANTAKVRIFNPTAEMPFAGHPTVGTGYVLAQMRGGDGLRLEVPAGLVEVSIQRNAKGDVVGGVIAAPQPLSTGMILPADHTAACATLQVADLVTETHPPILASTGNPFFFVEVTPQALTRAAPNLAAFQAALAVHSDELDTQRLALHLYARDGDKIRTRMFAPLAGTWEDPATGSANVTLAALLLSFTNADEGAWDIIQGVEMGRPSLLKTTARKAADGIRSTVGGGCVPVLRGEAELQPQ
ncbi:PhzF family phenazine biosynthesis protein [Caulobacter sp. NIBR2454]|uniref:PhzF family phenazine biosynthesis protein n=1 Tax=Caulobacter sp. NIBR2454 TaxID=3015996 RepID=UPI0022B6A26D|nr:PhzF family phenazine biosynthesis protein [Caulobacter sp. NIBR2454]